MDKSPNIILEATKWNLSLFHLIGSDIRTISWIFHLVNWGFSDVTSTRNFTLQFRVYEQALPILYQMAEEKIQEEKPSEVNYKSPLGGTDVSIVPIKRVKFHCRVESQNKAEKLVHDKHLGVNICTLKNPKHDEVIPLMTPLEQNTKYFQIKNVNNILSFQLLPMKMGLQIMSVYAWFFQASKRNSLRTSLKMQCWISNTRPGKKTHNVCLCVLRLFVKKYGNNAHL